MEKYGIEAPPPYQPLVSTGAPQAPAYPTQAPAYPPQAPTYQPQHATYPPQAYPVGPTAPPNTNVIVTSPTHGSNVVVTSPTAGGSSNVLVAQQGPPVIITSGFHQLPVNTKCPYCQAQVVTAMSHEPGTFAVMMGAFLCLIGLGAGCCLIPCCTGGCMDVIHKCPNCQQTIGRYNRM